MSKKTNAVRLLEKSGIAFSLKEYDWSINDKGVVTVNSDPNRDLTLVYKTLVTTCNQTGPIVAVIPVNETLDLKKLAKVSGNKKIEMLDVNLLEKLTGYVHGGCSPVGMKKLYPTYLAKEATDKETIFVSAGKRGAQIGLSPKDLLESVKGSYADITL